MIDIVLYSKLHRGVIFTLHVRGGNGPASTRRLIYCPPRWNSNSPQQGQMPSELKRPHIHEAEIHVSKVCESFSNRCQTDLRRNDRLGDGVSNVQKRPQSPQMRESLVTKRTNQVGPLAQRTICRTSAIMRQLTKMYGMVFVPLASVILFKHVPWVVRYINLQQEPRLQR